MKSKFGLFFCIAILFLSSCCFEMDKGDGEITVPSEKNLTYIKVGVFDRNGDSPFCIIDAVEALKIDSLILPEVIGASDIMSDKLKEYDLILFPGGSGKSETNSLGVLGMKRIQNYVRKEGKAVLGICAGSYILSNTEGYPSLNLSGFKAIDIEHDHRGNGLVKFSVTDIGKSFFPELDTFSIAYCNYYEGPVLEPIQDSTISSMDLGTMLSDVHLIEGTPANMTNNKPFITASNAGLGKVVTFVGHPESTPGMRWMIPRMVRWATRNVMVSYSKNVVSPEKNTHEILFDRKLRAKNYDLFNSLFGSEEEKIHAIKEATELRCWSAKKWFNGMLRDSSPEVRITASHALLNLERTDAIPDFESAINIEKNLEVRKVLVEDLVSLKALLSCNK
ncbi:MAG: BPL-N domain-containing protein [Bacteroidales bacterium]